MFQTSWLTLAALAVALVAVSAQSRTRCPGGYAQGSEVERGRYWYLCDNGQLVPKGCLSDTRKRLNIWESFIFNDYEMTCILTDQGDLSFQFSACYKNGTRLQPEDTFTEGKWWYTCSKQGDNLALQVSGCVNEQGRRIRVGEEAESGEFFYECRRKTDGVVAICCAGCIHNGRRFKTGESLEDGKFWYSCVLKDRKCFKQCVGCTNFDQRLRDGDRYFKDEVVYQCQVRQDTADHRVVGCVQDDGTGPVERVIGCQWREGSKPWLYERTCVKKDDQRAVKQTTSCFYESNEAQYRIKPGCFQVVGDLAIGCKNSTAGPVFDSFPADQLQQAIAKNLRPC